MPEVGASHHAARRLPARLATGLYFGTPTHLAGPDLWCVARHEGRITTGHGEACMPRTRRRNAPTRWGHAWHRARHIDTSNALVRLRTGRADASVRAPNVVCTASAARPARNSGVNARGARGRGRGARTPRGVALRGDGAPTPAPLADHRDFLRAGLLARGAPLRRCAAPSAVWRAHKAPKRERRAAMLQPKWCSARTNAQRSKHTQSALCTSTSAHTGRLATLHRWLNR
jgi:hypothetical protein